MSNVSVTQLLLERLISTNGLAVRRNMEDDAFWYTSGKPGPFYINTENIAGKIEASETLNKLNNILKANLSKEQKATSIIETVSQVVNADETYDASINALVDYYLSQKNNKPSMISGGERRDWFFSIPFAKKLKIPPIFLYKNGEYHVTDHEGKSVELDLHDQKVLHVADIINQASSYLNRWIPILKNAGVEFSETLSVAVRSQEGMNRLRENNIFVISPLIVDIPLFLEAYNLGLINEFAYNEIILYYDSPKEWARQFVKGNSINYSQITDTVKEERVRSFKENDPYQLKNEFPSFFVKTI